MPVACLPPRGREPTLRRPWCTLGKMQFRENVPLAPLTTLKIGGPARWFAEAITESDLLKAVDFARSSSLPLFILGGGSNLLVSDAGFPGLVIHVALRGISESSDGSDRIFSVAAGEDWDHFVTHAVDRSCGGIECLAGIPGTVGGTPVQNVGAYGQEVATTIQTVRALDLASGRFVDLSRSQCGFEYRKSIFNTIARGRYIVVAVTYHLSTSSPAMLNYADIKQYFKDRPTPSLLEVAAGVREIRHGKGMLITPSDPDCRSAGSFFKNPVVPDNQLQQIQSSLAEQTVPAELKIPTYPAEPGFSKVPAAWLVERAGFSKGYILGNAAISSRHTLALINRGGASAAEIIALKSEIVAAVQQRFGIALEQEPVYVT
ncbi:MAG TPA: UDP-N-acetylmuramate dehydrogenase [Acidisarcina sp.]